MNIFFGIVALIICTTAGYFLGAKYKDRKVFFEDFNAFNNKLLNEISFSQRSLSEIIKGCGQNDSVFYEIIKSGDNLQETVNKKAVFLDDEEKNTLCEYIKTIGKTDKSTQENYLKSTQGLISEKIKKTSEEYRKYKNLHVKIGFLLGLMVLVALL